MFSCHLFPSPPLPCSFVIYYIILLLFLYNIYNIIRRRLRRRREETSQIVEGSVESSIGNKGIEHYLLFIRVFVIYSILRPYRRYFSNRSANCTSLFCDALLFIRYLFAIYSNCMIKTPKMSLFLFRRLTNCVQNTTFRHQHLSKNENWEYRCYFDKRCDFIRLSTDKFKYMFLKFAIHFCLFIYSATPIIWYAQCIIKVKPFG